MARAVPEQLAAQKEMACAMWELPALLWPLYEAWLEANYAVALAMDAGNFWHLHGAQAAAGAAWAEYSNARAALREDASR